MVGEGAERWLSPPGGRGEVDIHCSSETPQDLGETLQTGIRIQAFKVELMSCMGLGCLTLGTR